jgi:hypothetical protein
LGAGREPGGSFRIGAIDGPVTLPLVLSLPAHHTANPRLVIPRPSRATE